MFKIIELEQRSPAWHEFRLNHIGGSEAAIIMGTSSWGNKYDLWLEKLGLKEPSKFISPAMQRGIDLEATALMSFCNHIGIEMTPQVTVNLENDWMSASLDGLCTQNTTFVEIKCPGDDTHKVALNGDVPRQYYTQMQHQLAVTGLPYCYYYSFDGKDGVCIELVRNNTYIKELIQKEEEFWYCVQNFIPPEDNYQTLETQEWKDLTQHYMNCKNNIDSLNQQMEEAKKQLISYTNGMNTKGNGYKLSKIVKKGSVNYSCVRELSGVDLEPYRNKPSEYWKFESVKN